MIIFSQSVESFSPVNAFGRAFLSKLFRKLSAESHDDRQTDRRAVCFSHSQVFIQCFNTVLLHDSFVKEDHYSWVFPVHSTLPPDGNEVLAS